jgi:hypothetical protein
MSNCSSFLNSNPPPSLNDLLNYATKQQNTYCSKSGKAANWFIQYGLGIGSMFGMSALSSFSPDTCTQDVLNAAQNAMQGIVNTNTILFAQQQVKLEQDILTTFVQLNQTLTTNIQLVSTVLQNEIDIQKIEVFGLYILVLIIFFFLLIL